MSSKALLQREEKTYSTLTSVEKDTPKAKEENTWDNRTRFVVYGQGFLFIVAWAAALGPRLTSQFWNAEHNKEELEDIITNEDTPTYIVSFLRNVVLSYFNERFFVFFPHVAGAIIWLNLYYLQLIPSIRRKYRKFHRILGRVLMIAALCQSLSGVGLAYMGKLSSVKLVSYFLAISVVYCVYNAWYYAARKDIPKHKYWAMRLVGYLQTIALQRVFMAVLLLSHNAGWLGLYPPYDENDEETILRIFEDSFVCCFVVAMLLTEWYLAGYYGWTETTQTDMRGDLPSN